MQGLLDAKAVAERLGVRLDRVFTIARAGLLPTVHIGRSMRFDPAALEAWIAQGGDAREPRARDAAAEPKPTTTKRARRARG